ncbi:MAG: patatin-like phospholipase family protein, partial [Bacillota bacterium]
MKMKIDAIFEGGGIRGIGFVGAVCCMEEKGFQWQRVAGTSAGSIVAALLAAGYTGKELYEVINDTDYNKFLDERGIQTIPLLGKPLGLLFLNGMYRGDYIEQWMQGLLNAKGKTRFKDVMLDGECRLKIIASDITKRKILILPDNLPDYGIDPMEFEIAKAVRVSAGIPFCYNPVKLKYRDGVSYIVDGGIL